MSLERDSLALDNNFIMLIGSSLVQIIIAMGTYLLHEWIFYVVIGFWTDNNFINYILTT